MEYKSKSLRLGEDVWAALQKHEKSANQLLREALGLNGSTYTPEIEAKMEANIRPKSVLRDRPRLLKPKEKK